MVETQVHFFSHVKRALYQKTAFDKYTSILSLYKLLCPPFSDAGHVRGLAGATALSPVEASFLPALDFSPLSVGDTMEVGRPDRPRLVPVRALPKRDTHSEQGRLHLMHAVAHIEFNAINLALDAAYRFQTMSMAFYQDWLFVALQECEHFFLIARYLEERGCHYGCYDAHNGLWEMAEKTRHDVLVRMALVPRLLEARGLDVTPGMIQKLEKAGDGDAVRILGIIYRDEVGHVRIGNKWFNACCQARGVSPIDTFQSLLARYASGVCRPPFNRDMRRKAGFSERELDTFFPA